MYIIEIFRKKEINIITQISILDKLQKKNPSEFTSHFY